MEEPHGEQTQDDRK